jgi:hypothetical protein
VRLRKLVLVSADYDYSELHAYIDGLEPAEAEELTELARRRFGVPLGGRFRALRAYPGPALDLGAQAKRILRGEVDPYGCGSDVNR